MSLKLLESKWKVALTSILEELTESQFKKLLFNLDKIPQGVKSDKVREEMPLIIIQYFGTEDSISIIDKEMKQLPRMDAAVQSLLRPFVDKLKKQRQKNKETASKVAADSGSVAKRKKPAAETASKVAADSGSVAKKKKPAAETTSKLAADSGSVAKKQKPAPDQQKSCKPDKIEIDPGSVKPKQKKTEKSLTSTGATKVSKTDPVESVKPKQKKTEKSLTSAGVTNVPMFIETKPVESVKPKQKKTEKSLTSTGATKVAKMDSVESVKPKQKTEKSLTSAGVTKVPKPKQKKTEKSLASAGATNVFKVEAAAAKPRKMKTAGTQKGQQESQPGVSVQDSTLDAYFDMFSSGVWPQTGW